MRAEERVLKNLDSMIRLTFSACETLKKAILENNYQYLEEVSRIEKEGDELRRLIGAEIFEGAFLPYLRPSIFALAEKIDEILNTAYHITLTYKKIRNKKLLEHVLDEIELIMDANIRLCSILSKNFLNFLKNHERLKEMTIVVMMIEKEVDDLASSVLDRLSSIEVDFWDGIFIYNFVELLERISDLAEELSDALQRTALSL